MCSCVYVCVGANSIQFALYSFYPSAAVMCVRVTLYITGEEFEARTDVADVSSGVM